MSSTAIRVAVIDDHQVFADALASRLREEQDLTVVGTARAASDSWELLQRHDVDVIALDLDLAGDDGLRLGREILGTWPDIIATGGDAERLFAGWEVIHAISPDLTLYGVALAYTNHHIKHGS